MHGIAHATRVVNQLYAIREQEEAQLHSTVTAISACIWGEGTIEIHYAIQQTTRRFHTQALRTHTPHRKTTTHITPHRQEKTDKRKQDADPQADK